MTCLLDLDARCHCWVIASLLTLISVMSSKHDHLRQVPIFSLQHQHRGSTSCRHTWTTVAITSLQLQYSRLAAWCRCPTPVLRRVRADDAEYSMDNHMTHMRHLWLMQS